MKKPVVLLVLLSFIMMIFSGFVQAEETKSDSSDKKEVAKKKFFSDDDSDKSEDKDKKEEKKEDKKEDKKKKASEKKKAVKAARPVKKVKASHSSKKFFSSEAKPKKRAYAETAPSSSKPVETGKKAVAAKTVKKVEKSQPVKVKNEPVKVKKETPAPKAAPAPVVVKTSEKAVETTSVRKEEVSDTTDSKTEDSEEAGEEDIPAPENKPEPIIEAKPEAAPVKSDSEVLTPVRSQIAETEQNTEMAPEDSVKENLAIEEKKEPEQNSRITAIEVRGNKSVPTEKILAVIRSKVGDLLLRPRVRSDSQSIYEMGYFTDVKPETRYYAGGFKLVFIVQENPVVNRITVYRSNKIVDKDGKELVTTAKIRELLKTKEGKILNLKTLNTDMSEINYYYNETLGYPMQPTHITDVKWTPSGDLILTIKEGLTIKTVDIQGSSLYTNDKLMSLIDLKPGGLLSSKMIETASNKLDEFYKDEGYILDTIRPKVNYQEGIITFQIIEAVVEEVKIEFIGKKHKTKEYVVRRNIRTKEGEVLQRRKLQKDIERLNNTQYFSKVSVDPEPGSKPGYLILVFKVKDQKTGLATIGVGYAGGGSDAVRSGITGAISFSEKNLGGTGQAASISWQRGVTIDAIGATYSNPAINKNQDSISLSLFRNNYFELRQPQTVNGETVYALYDDKRVGGKLTYGRRINDDFRLFLSHRRESLTLEKNAESDYNPVNMSKGTLSTIGLGALYDVRNDVFDPTSGMYFMAEYTKGGGFMGGSYDYDKVSAEIRKYIPLDKKARSTIALRAWGGMLKGATAPVTETFYVGGSDTIRGYSENEFYGTRMVVLNAEYRFPIGNIKFLKGAVFGDAGSAWFPGGTNKLHYDGGAGLRIVFPTLGLGVIRVDYAYGSRGGRTSIGIGQTF